ncbi:MAG: hypothetical protein A3D31_13555 [Candidatus Fluviicola riflensis]|nr:MAG: hypothetical protein CHH17_17990 [Candidatus Fluviicola riflensis]OGS78004.1 MAG: hypothetical protein A3D31_13555 [Candidatus Fluviicola riflensis]OGS85069.1 MAG: hypothetical protein A2724_10490 [Fluviicola sp. RIFCSPHIGHO2_01_FULL_43_53]OGS89341.1 MAG: hypothetical protein A3E30_04795 [Fluviicola sp. RIFCSPHIGHO2_12_FULL_43_24]
MQKGMLILLLLCMFSCTVEKRVYLPGYSIHWKHRKGTVKNDAVALLLKEENNSVIISETTEMESHEAFDSYKVADTAVQQEIRPTETIVVSSRNDYPPQLKQQSIRQKAGINNAFNEDPEEERTPKSPNGLIQFLAVLLGIIFGVICSAFFVVLLFSGADFSSFGLNDDVQEGQRTFKSVFAAAFRITFIAVSALLIITALVLLAIFLYLAYGIWALIFTIIGIILILLLLTFLFGKAFDFVFHER